MNLLLLQLLLLLLLAACMGWLVGGWWQRAAARQRESALKAQLKITGRKLQRRSAMDSASKVSTNQLATVPLGARTQQADLASEQVLAMRTELGIAEKRLNSAEQELAQQQDALAQAKTEALQWQSAYRQMEGTHEGLSSARANLSNTRDASHANAEAMQQLQADLQQAEVTLAESEQCIQALHRTEAAAKRNVGRMRKLYLKLHAKFEEARQQNHHTKARRLAAEQQVDKLTETVARTKEIAETLRSEFIKRRSYVAKLRADLERAQTRLTGTQRQADNIANQHKQVNEVNESLRRALAAEQQQNRLASRADMQAPVEPPLPESSSVKSVSISSKRQVKALETIVRNQRAKLDLLGDVVGDMQVLLRSDQSLALRTRRQLPPRRGIKTPG